VLDKVLWNVRLAWIYWMEKTLCLAMRHASIYVEGKDVVGIGRIVEMVFEEVISNVFYTIHHMSTTIPV
jgi:hypothetical protein